MSSGVFLAWLLAFYVACRSHTELVWVKHLKKIRYHEQWRIQAPPSFFDQNDARRVEKVFSETAPPLPLSQALDDRVPALSEGLDSPLMRKLLVELLLSVTYSVLARLTLTSQTAACIAYKNRK